MIRILRSRPLGFFCALFLLSQVMILTVTGGKVIEEIPASSIFKTRENQLVEVEGQVCQKRNTSNAQIYILRNNSVPDSKLMIYDKKFTDIPIGKVIRIRGKASLFDVAANPGNFSERAYYHRQKLYGSISMDELVYMKGKEQFIKEQCFQFKMRCKQRMFRIMGEKNGGILAAMILGEKSGMDESVKEVYQKMGIGHVLAISGLHISFIGIGIYSILRKGNLPFMLAGFISIAVLSLYVCMIGLSVSVFRAFLMLLFKIGSDVTGRCYDMWTAVLLSATLTVLYQPMYLTDGGFILSYGAILGILVLVPTLKKYVPSKRKVLDGLYANLAITIMLIPVMLFYYYEVATYSVLLNLIVIPLMSVLIFMGIVGGFLSMDWCLKLCGILLDLIEVVASWFESIPFSRIVFGKPDIWMIGCYYLVLLYLVWCGRNKKKCRRWKLILIFIPLLIFGIHLKRDVELTMLNVGQGDCIYLRGEQGVHMLIDGGSSDVKQVGKYRMEPFLLSKGVNTLDYVFLSHGDSDHMNGIAEMILRQKRGVRIQRLVVSENYKYDEKLMEVVRIAKENNIKVMVFPMEQTLKVGGMDITCLHPKEDKNLSDNASSMVLDVQYKNCNILFTGDVEANGEEQLIQTLSGKSYDILKVAHHGSKNSGSEEFLLKTRPQIALISVGEGNAYGHPHKETLERLKKIGCQYFETKKNGAITIRTNGNSLTIEAFP